MCRFPLKTVPWMSSGSLWVPKKTTFWHKWHANPANLYIYISEIDFGKGYRFPLIKTMLYYFTLPRNSRKNCYWSHCCSFVLVYDNCGWNDNNAGLQRSDSYFCLINLQIVHWTYWYLDKLHYEHLKCWRFKCVHILNGYHVHICEWIYYMKIFICELFFSGSFHRNDTNCLMDYTQVSVHWTAISVYFYYATPFSCCKCNV